METDKNCYILYRNDAPFGVATGELKDIHDFIEKTIMMYVEDLQQQVTNGWMSRVEIDIDIDKNESVYYVYRIYNFMFFEWRLEVARFSCSDYDYPLYEC